MSTDKKSTASVILKILALAAVLGGIAAYFIFTPVALADEDKSELLSEGRFLSGLSVNGTDIGGMTFKEAESALKKTEDDIKSRIFLTLNFQGQRIVIPPESMRISFDTEKVLNDALLLAQEGDLITRTRVREGAREGTNLKIHCTVDSLTAAARAADEAKKLECAPQNALAVFLPEERGFRYTHEITGIRINTDELTKRVYDACEELDFSAIDIPYEQLAPEITEDMLRAVTVRRSVFSTSFAEEPYNNANRVYNIKKCVSIVNASEKTVLKPGETLSLNDVLGDRTAADGWRPAPGYVGGRSEDQPGGGVCQVSTTLYCAALAADLEVPNRINHSIPVGYSKKGLDATISTGGPDLVIKNSTGSNIYICAWASAEQRLYFEVFGEPFSGFTSIELASVKIRDIEPEGEMKITMDDSHPADYEEIYVKRRTGSFWRTYKVYMNNGEEINREEADTSTYRAYDGEKIVGVP